MDHRSLSKLGTTLHKAVEKKHVAVVSILLQAGADRALRDAQGRTAADIAVMKGLDAAMLMRLKPG